ncbi:transposase family protein, partial [Massilimicrobiota sp. An142]|uniref:transposase family protein n=1 Tax=Massilimicrobiota sp. An142 TaxID=1965564 RepID=UPI00117CA3A5
MVMTMCDNTTTMSSCIISQNDFLVFFNIEDKDIETFDIHHQKDGIYIDVTLKKKPHQCPVCLNMTDRVKDYSVKHINHSILTNKKCIINYRARRYRCP